MGNEILAAGSVSFVITLIGLALGFALLKLQGEQKPNIYIIYKQKEIKTCIPFVLQQQSF